VYLSIQPRARPDFTLDRVLEGIALIILPAGCRIYLALESINMHASFDKLALLVEEAIHQSPLNGHQFVFRNRQRDKLKALLWDRNGFSIYYRRIEKGRFKIPKNEKRLR